MTKKKKWRRRKLHGPDLFELMWLVASFGTAIVYGIYDLLS